MLRRSLITARFVHHHRTHAGEIESAQERARGQLAGTAHVDHELHQRIARLAHFARKFICAADLLEIVVARRKNGPLVAQRVEQIVEVPGEAAGFLFRVYAGLLRGPHGHGHAEDLARFLIGKCADEIGEEWQAVRLGEEDVDRESDAERLCDICETGLQIAGGCRDRIGALREKDSRLTQSSTARGDCAPPLSDFSLPGCRRFTRRIQLPGSPRMAPPASTSAVPRANQRLAARVGAIMLS